MYILFYKKGKCGRLLGKIDWVGKKCDFLDFYTEVVLPKISTSSTDKENYGRNCS